MERYMQESLTHFSPLITSESRQVQATEAPIFPSGFDSILFWDGFVPTCPNDDGVIWSNTHATTLEDYKVKDAFELLYTPDAIDADEKQREREYKELGGVK